MSIAVDFIFLPFFHVNPNYMILCSLLKTARIKINNNNKNRNKKEHIRFHTSRPVVALTVIVKKPAKPKEHSRYSRLSSWMPTFRTKALLCRSRPSTRTCVTLSNSRHKLNECSCWPWLPGRRNVLVAPDLQAGHASLWAAHDFQA